MRYFRRSLIMMILLLMSGIFMVSNIASGNMATDHMAVTYSYTSISELGIHEEMQHESPFCHDNACAISATCILSCLQHCDHQSVIPFDYAQMPAIDHLTGALPHYQAFISPRVLSVELKPPQISLS